MNTAIFNTICYTIGWFWSVLLGIHGYGFLSFLGVVALLALQLFYTKKYSPILYIQDLILAIFATFFGIILEILFLLTGTISYLGTSSFFPPVWIIGLYPLFSLLINHSLNQITQNFAITFVLGFLAAPLSYFAGKALGGLTFGYSQIVSWLIIGILWGLFLCLLRYIANTIKIAASITWNEKDKKDDLKFFYDGNCPICSREVCHLQNLSHNKNMKFVDITAEEEFLKERGQLDYETAMKAMHASDTQGNLYVALDAFAKAYARCGQPFLATILNISFLRPILNPMYHTFAKHRLFLTGRSKK
jgi:predicted DCC family thiol-disulfide oxidoreductase YuxK